MAERDAAQLSRDVTRDVTIATLAVYVGLRSNRGAWHYVSDVCSRLREIFDVFLLRFMF